MVKHYHYGAVQDHGGVAVAITATLVGSLGSAQVTYTPLPEFTELSGTSGTLHPLAKVTVPVGESWFVYVSLQLTKVRTGTGEGSAPTITVNGWQTTIAINDTTPQAGAILNAGTHILGVTTNTTTASYRISGNGGYMTIKI